MRLLVMGDSKEGSFSAFEITDAGYDDDITCVKDDNGNYDRYQGAPITGLYFVDIENNWWYIPGLSAETCNQICKELVEKGFADVTKYGEYTDLDGVEEMSNSPSYIKI